MSKEFNNELKRELVKKGFKETDLEFSILRKNNGEEVEALSIYNLFPVEENGEKIAPSIHMTPFMESYENGRSIKEIAEEISAIVDNLRVSPTPNFKTEQITSWEKAKGRAVFVLVNKDKNEEMCQNAPHMDFLDYTLIFKVDLDGATVTINNGILEKWGISFQELLEVALKNTPAIYPGLFCSMPELLGISDMDEVLFVSTNKTKYMGAGAMLYEDFAPEKKGLNNPYVIPSSIHETLFVTDTAGGNIDELENMVGEVNAMDCVGAQEYLGSKVHRFNEIREEFSKAVKQALG